MLVWVMLIPMLIMFVTLFRFFRFSITKSIIEKESDSYNKHDDNNFKFIAQMKSGVMELRMRTMMGSH
jgi:hypothetical protein